MTVDLNEIKAFTKFETCHFHQQQQHDGEGGNWANRQTVVEG
jgi:hypothetical protein